MKETIYIVDNSEVVANGTQVYQDFGENVTFLETVSGAEEKLQSGFSAPNNTNLVTVSGCGWNDFVSIGENLFELRTSEVGGPLLTAFRQDFRDYVLPCGEHSSGIIWVNDSTYHFCDHLVTHPVDFEYFTLNLLISEAITLTADKHLGFALLEKESRSIRFGRRWKEMDLRSLQEFESSSKLGPERL